jgi:hypothetical protein
MKNMVNNEEFLSSKKEEMIAIAQLFGVLLVAPLMILASCGIVLVGDSNRKLDEKCAQEVLDGIAESHQECRNYYIKEKR